MGAIVVPICLARHELLPLAEQWRNQTVLVLGGFRGLGLEQKAAANDEYLFTKVSCQLATGRIGWNSRGWAKRPVNFHSVQCFARFAAHCTVTVPCLAVFVPDRTVTVKDRIVV